MEVFYPLLLAVLYCLGAVIVGWIVVSILRALLKPPFKPPEIVYALIWAAVAIVCLIFIGRALIAFV